MTFPPERLVVRPGLPVGPTLVNRGRLDHTFAVPEFNVEVMLPALQTQHLTLVVLKESKWRILCNAIGHFDTMKGTLVAAP